jgi:hypothetical protein
MQGSVKGVIAQFLWQGFIASSLPEFVSLALTI